MTYETYMQVRKQNLELDMEQQTGSKWEKEYIKAVYYHPAYLTYMQSTSWRKAGLEETQAGIKIARRNTNKVIYADDTTLMAEIEEEVTSLLMKVKEESEKAGLKPSIQKTKFMTNRWGNNGNSERLHFWGLQNHCRWWLQPWN